MAARSSISPAPTTHPGAWWLWGLGLCLGVSRVTNPIVLALVIAVAALVVASCRPTTSWSRGFGAYLVLGLSVVLIRMTFRALLGTTDIGEEIFALPSFQPFGESSGITVGGPVTDASMLSALYDGMRLATILIVLGAVNVIADAKRLLRVFPGALYELGTVLTVTLTMAPQLVESGRRIGRAQLLRGAEPSKFRALPRMVTPVMADALDRSLLLAASMDSRGYGRSGAVAAGRRRYAASLVLAGVFGAAVGTYGALDATAPAVLGVPLLLGGLGVAVAGIVLGAQEVHRTKYRPDPWTLAATLVAASGLAVAVLFSVQPWSGWELNTPVNPANWPEVSIRSLLCVSLAALPAAIAASPVETNPRDADLPAPTRGSEVGV